MGRDMDEPVRGDPAAIHAFGVIGRDDRAIGSDGDEAGADRVYALAMKRKPARLAAPKPPELFVDVSQGGRAAGPVGVGEVRHQRDVGDRVAVHQQQVSQRAHLHHTQLAGVGVALAGQLQ